MKIVKRQPRLPGLDATHVVVDDDGETSSVPASHLVETDIDQAMGVMLDIVMDSENDPAVRGRVAKDFVMLRRLLNEDERKAEEARTNGSEAPTIDPSGLSDEQLMRIASIYHE